MRLPCSGCRCLPKCVAAEVPVATTRYRSAPSFFTDQHLGDVHKMYLALGYLGASQLPSLEVGTLPVLQVST